MTQNTEHWVRTWSASPQAAEVAVHAIDDATLRQEVRVSCGGDRLRLRISNEFGATGLRIGAASVALAGQPAGQSCTESAPIAHIVTFGGARCTFVPSGAPVVSDPIDLDVPALATLVVSLYVPGHVDSLTGHNILAGPGWVLPGDQTAAATVPEGAQEIDGRLLLSAVEVHTAEPAAGIVAIGGSITDGAGATLAAGGGWPALLGARLVAAGGRPAAVANQGISGDQLLNDGFGPSILGRLDRDVLSSPGLTHVILFEGMNDIVFSIAPGHLDPEFADLIAANTPVTADDLIGGFQQIIARCHLRGVPVYAGTLTPFADSGLDSPAAETVRQQVNAWMRTSGAFDAVFDFDAIWRNPDRPDRTRAEFDFGDHLHGNDAGHAALAASIDLGLFS